MTVELQVNWLDKIEPWNWFDLEIIEFNEDRIEREFEYQIYVDGSKKQSVGGAYLIKYKYDQNEIESIFRLPDFCSVFQSEIYSIYLALEKLIEDKIKKSWLIIICDNQGALLSLNNYFNQQPIALKIRNSINK